MSPVVLFIVFNVVAAPLLGRLLWMGMGGLEGDGQRLLAVLLSLAGAFGILVVNVVLTRAAAARALPKPGVVALALVSLLTFGLTVGTGFFSPINLVIALAAG